MKKRGKKRAQAVLEEVEAAPRRPQWDGAKERAASRLPTLSLTGEVKRATVPHSMTPLEAERRAAGSEEEEEEEEGKPDGSASESEPELPAGKRRRGKKAPVHPPLRAGASPQEVAVRRETIKAEMAEIAEMLIENPEKHISGTSKSQLKKLHHMTSDPDPAVQRLAQTTQVLVFRDIVPGYRVRLPTAKELAVTVKKEVKKLRDFEGALLAGYTRFTRYLLAEMDAPAEVEGPALTAALAALKSVCELVRTLPHFNCRKEMVEALVRRMSHKNDVIALTACAAIRDLFKADVSPEGSVEAVRALARVVKARGVKTRPEALEALLALPLQTAVADEAQRGKKKRIKDGIVEGGDFEELRDTRRVNRAAALKDVLTVYFRLLRTEGNANVLSPVLAGLSKFAHLVDVGVVMDLIASFRVLIAGELLPLDAALSCVLTVLKILRGPGQLLNVDDEHFTQFLFRCLPRLATNQQHTWQAIECVETLLLKRREFSPARVGKYIKLLVSVVPSLDVHQALAVLAFVRRVFQRYPDSTQLLDAASERAVSGPTDTLWELNLLTGHYHPDVRQFAADTIAMKPLPPAHGHYELFNVYDMANGKLVPPFPLPPRPLALRVAKADAGVGTSKHRAKVRKDARRAHRRTLAAMMESFKDYGDL